MYNLHASIKYGSFNFTDIEVNLYYTVCCPGKQVNAALRIIVYITRHHFYRLLSRTRSQRTHSQQSTVSISFKYNPPLPRWPYSSHNNYDLKYTISPWKTPEGQRHFIVSSLSSFCPRTLPTLAQTQQSFMEYNKVQLQLTCHLFSFSDPSFGE